MSSKKAEQGPEAAEAEIPVGDQSPIHFDALGNPLDPATINPAEPAPVAPGPAEPLPKAKKGQRLVRYVGTTDLLEYEGGIQFRPGTVAPVPSDLAEEILTNPRERFQEVTEQDGD